MSDNSFESVLAQADDAHAAGEYDAAIEDYKKALMLADADDVLGRATVYTAIGATKRVQGKAREAELNYDKALAAMPGFIPALRALVEIAEAEGDTRRVVDRRRRLAQRLADPADKAMEFATIGALLAGALKDPRGAMEAYEKARELAPGNVAVLERLRGLYEQAMRWSKVVELLGALCTEHEDAGERAKLRFAQADITLGRMRDDVQGTHLLEAALEEDPRHDQAFQALVAVRTRLGQWEELQREYARLIDRFAEQGALERAHEICQRLAILRRDKLSDGPGAIEAFRGALQCGPGDVDSRAALAELLILKGALDDAVSELARCAEHAPARAQTYRRLFETLQKHGQPDRAWLAAVCLLELGAGELDHHLAVDQFKRDGTIRPNAQLGDDGWELVRAPGADPVLAAMFAAVRVPAVGARVADLRDRKKLVVLDPSRRQDPRSTATVVRTFAWAAHVLSVELPALYMLDEVGAVAAAQVEEPSTAIGPSLCSGVSRAELAFVVGRHLAYYRPEHYALVFYPTLQELTTLFLAALKVVRPDTPVPDDPSIRRLCKQLDKHLPEDGRAALDAAVVRLEERGGRADLAAWIKSVELTAQRAGALLVGDPQRVFARIKGEERPLADLGVEERRSDMLAALVSDGFERARQRLGARVGPSLPPPADEPTTSDSAAEGPIASDAPSGA